MTASMPQHSPKSVTIMKPMNEKRRTVLSYLASHTEDWAWRIEIEEALKGAKGSFDASLEWLIDQKFITRTMNGGRAFFVITKSGIDAISGCP